MKLKNIINTLSLAAVALVATGCQDTDAQINIAEAYAPELVSVTPATADVVLYGEKTFKVKFNERIFFATKNTSLITLNGVPVKKASVIGADSVLTIVADVDFKKTQTLNIPAGLILGPQKTPLDQELSFTWTINELPSNDATAMTKKLGWGWNLGNHFDTSDTQWGYWDGATPTAATFQTIANAGGRTVRVPVTWTNHMDANQTIDAAYLNEVKGVVDLAVNAGLNVILNTHHDSFEKGIKQSAEKAEQAKADSALISTLWTQVANKFADYGDNLIFETFNEVHGADYDENGNITSEDWGNGSEAQFAMLNQWNQWAVNAIRATGGNNAQRWIGVSGYAANIDLTLAHLVLPTDPANHIMVGVHCYDPYNFCLHPMNDDGSVLANSWGHNADPSFSTSGANEEYVLAQLYKLRTSYIEKGIPCYLGEYGCVWQTTDLANKFRAYYLEFFCRAAYLAGIPMFVWDNNAKNAGNEANGYIDHATGAWVNDSETMVPIMVKACTSTDESYWFEAIWAKSPER
jgi:endoglucanase